MFRNCKFKINVQRNNKFHANSRYIWLPTQYKLGHKYRPNKQNLDLQMAHGVRPV